MNAHQRRTLRRAHKAWRAREASKPKDFDWSVSNPPVQHARFINCYAGEARDRSMSLEELVRITREQNPDSVVMVTHPLLTKEMLNGLY